MKPLFVSLILVSTIGTRYGLSCAGRDAGRLAAMEVLDAAAAL